MPRRSTSIEADEESRRNPRRSKSKPVYADSDRRSNNSDDEEKDESVEIDGTDDDEEVENFVEEAPMARRSARSTKFNASLKEPSDSVRDLVNNSKDQPAKTRRSRSNSDEDSDSTRGSAKASSRRQSHRRQKRREDVTSDSTDASENDDDDDDDDGDDDDDDDDDDESELKIQRIVASRTEKLGDWQKICQKLNTAEIQYGSRWFQGEMDENEADKFEERFLVKWSDLSFLHCSWETETDLFEQIENAKTHMTVFFKKSVNGCLFTSDERCDGDYFDPAFTQIDRIVEVFDNNGNPILKGPAKPDTKCHDIVKDRNDPEFEKGTGRQFLVRWANTPYAEMTYEFERDLIINEVDYEDKLEGYFERCQKPSKIVMRKMLTKGEEELRKTYKIFGDKSTIDESEKENKVVAYQKALADIVFPNGGQLRDYQAEGVSWLVANFVNKRSSILADEMGLGKTLQTCAFVNTVANKLNHKGPALIIAPLSTLAHWQREFEAWTDLNAIVYHGTSTDRKFIREQEFPYPEDRPKGGVPANFTYLKKCMAKTKSRLERIWMAQVVITTPEMITTDDFMELTAVEWELLVVDEAHRLKNFSSKLASKLRNDRFKFGHTLLLTGTPIQNNMTELWTLLNVVDKKKFGYLDEFLENYGDMQSKETVDELHENIRPYFLRRLKEDVEKSVPPKEETLIEVELTSVQKTYYRALYEKNVQFLRRSKKKSLHAPSINNLAMQLRKCCNHPFLLNGVEDDLRLQESKDTGAKVSEGDFLVKFSGKLVLLDKLLPRLRDDGHRVLLFSQFKIMLDIIEDYLNVRGFKNERIDGSITGKKRQQAIDRFQSPVEGEKELPLVMLLSTRAGGVGINLTAADTCIIFDSDWNPQNDLQAQARCHRIGQTKSVKIYRLLTRKTYEMQMFHMSSLKMGLDQAVLNGFESGGGNDTMSKEDVERLLKHGAYDIFNEVKEGTAEAESNAFIQQDIDSILERRTKTVVHENTGSQGNAKGGTFSKASFKATKSPSKGNVEGEAKEEVDVDDPDFWTKMVGEEHFKGESDEYEGKKRSRKVQNYSETAYSKRIEQQIQLSDDDMSSSGQESSDEESDYSDSPDPMVLIDEESEMNALESEAITKVDESTPLASHPTPVNKGQKGITKVVESAPVASHPAPDNKGRKGKREMSSWGRKRGNGWDKVAAEKVIKGLQAYGYANIGWTEFQTLSKLSEYSVDEIKHMSWSMLLMSFLELAEESVVSERRKADRAAEKKRVGGDKEVSQDPKGGVLGRTSSSNFNSEIVLEEALKKAWAQNSEWAGALVVDAIQFIKANRARSRTVVRRVVTQSSGSRKRTGTQSPSELFAETVWPALRVRGWKTIEVEHDGSISKRYSRGSQIFKTTAQVTAAIPHIHPELNAMVLQVQHKINTIRKDTAVTLNFRELASGRVNSHMLKLLLHHYAPLQFLADRGRVKKLHFYPKKLVLNCLYISNAHRLSREAKGVPFSDEFVSDIADRLDQLTMRLQVPHPKWTKKHDAFLIGAIVKHGWVDHDDTSRIIFEDKEIQWGHPFEQSTETVTTMAQSSDGSGGIAKQLLINEHKAFCEAAARVATFVTNEQTLINTLREFRQDQLVKVFSLEQRINDDVEKHMEYFVNLDRMRKDSGSGGSSDAVDSSVSLSKDLPTKREILKRAKAILSRSFPPKVVKEVADATTNEVKAKHGYYVVDQQSKANQFLVELLRSLVKVSFSNSEKRKAMGRKLMAYALQEVMKRKEDLRANAALTNEENDQVAVKGMDNLFEHLDEVSNSVEKQPVQAKNVLRAILGMPFTQPKHGGLFPEPQGLGKLQFVNAGKKKEPSPAKEQQAGSKKSKKNKKSMETGSVGDRGLSLAMARAKDEMDGKGKISNEARRGYLELTALETLLLTVVCSQGLPVWTSDWVDLVLPSDRIQPESQGFGFHHAISWHGMGHVFESAASVWYEAAKAKLENFQHSFDVGCSNLPDGNAMKEKEKNKLRVLGWELRSRKVALAVARNYNNDPLALAKKTVMLLEVVRSRMGTVDTKRGNNANKIRKQNKSEFGLSPIVLHWFSKEVERWAESLELTDISGRPIAYSAIDYAEDGTIGSEDGNDLMKPAALMDRKGCRNVMIQISQQTRSRSIWLKSGEHGMMKKLEKAIKTSGDCNEWADQPDWWGKDMKTSGGSWVKHDLTMMDSLLQNGYSGIEEKMNSFTKGDGAKLTRFAIQYRANQLTRELHFAVETEEAMERIRSVVNTGGSKVTYDSESTETDVESTTRETAKPGIDSFFKTQSEPEVRDVVVVEIDSPAQSPQGKRKFGVSMHEDPEKKLKIG